MSVLRYPWRVLSSFGLSCALLILLGLLTWLGTLEQVDHGLYEVQKKYFESFILVHHLGPIGIPLPGANLVLWVLFANLLVGGIVRMRKGASTAGILIAHFGIVFMLLAGLVKMYFSEDGHVTLWEGERSSHFQSWHRWELVVLEDQGNGRVCEHIVEHPRFADATLPARFTAPDLPFELVVDRFFGNSRPLPKGPMFEVEVPVVDGVFLREMQPDLDNERNIAGAYVAVVDAAGERQTGIVWGAQDAPWTVEVAGKPWSIDLRRERYDMPFTLALEDFKKEDHPRLNMAKAFESDVTVIEGSTARPVTISMNEPLRDRGLVLYQTSWGPSTAAPGDKLYSTFSVVRNPADRFPLYACIVIAAGLCLHFSRKLVRFVRLEARTT